MNFILRESEGVSESVLTCAVEIERAKEGILEADVGLVS